MTQVALKVQADERGHLSEDQIDDQLMGDLGSEAAAHLAACKVCSLRVAEAAEPMATVREVTIAWSERRSATMPIPVVQADGFLWQRRTRWAMTACAVVVGISFTANAHRIDLLRSSVQSAQNVDTTRSARTQVAAVPVSVERGDGAGAGAGAEQYSGDNRMLKAIDTELDASIETPAAMGLETVSDASHGQDGQISVQD